jgi:hypothetical protein
LPLPVLAFLNANKPGFYWMSQCETSHFVPANSRD